MEGESLRYEEEFTVVNGQLKLPSAGWGEGFVVDVSSGTTSAQSSGMSYPGTPAEGRHHDKWDITLRGDRLEMTRNRRVDWRIGESRVEVFRYQCERTEAPAQER